MVDWALKNNYLPTYLSRPRHNNGYWWERKQGGYVVGRAGREGGGRGVRRDPHNFKFCSFEKEHLRLSNKVCRPVEDSAPANNYESYYQCVRRNFEHVASMPECASADGLRGKHTRVHGAKFSWTNWHKKSQYDGPNNWRVRHALLTRECSPFGMRVITLCVPCQRIGCASCH